MQQLMMKKDLSPIQKACIKRYGNDTGTGMAEYFHCSPETTTTF